MRAIAAEEPEAAAEPRTVTITTTVTGLVPSIVDPESLMDAIEAQMSNHAATRTVTIFTTISDGDGDEELSDIESDFDLVDMSQNDEPSETDTQTTPCNSVMTLGSMTITLPTQLQCPIIGEDTSMDSDSDSGDSELATPEPTSDASDLGGLDSMQGSDEPCFMVLTIDSVIVTFTNKNSACASNTLTDYGGDDEGSSPLPTEPEPTMDLPSDEFSTDESSTDESLTDEPSTDESSTDESLTDEPSTDNSLSESITETDSSSDTELHSLDEPTSEVFSDSESSSNVAKPVMGSLGFGIYQTNDEFLTCKATPSA
ncbi:hypothetical protein EV183_005376 [Coemansia sp. RSA 2336]|nr:hypothetical protein EV183_005376 [Coemansia sp. RSA 2336]